MRRAYLFFSEKLNGRDHSGPTCRCVDSIRMHLRETRWEETDWVHLNQYRDQWWSLVNMVMKRQNP
jgi:hypothetical protein